jgi:hypothetical protein
MRFIVVVLFACSHRQSAMSDASSADTNTADGSIDAALDPFWPTCGQMAIDDHFLNDYHAPVVIGRDGTLYGPARASGGTVIARERPGLPAEPAWVTVAPQQLDAVDGLAPAAGTLYMTGWSGGVHGVYAISPGGSVAPLGPPFPPGTEHYELLEVGAGALYVAAYDRGDILRVDLATGARTVAVPIGAAGIVHFTFASPATLLVATLNAGSLRVELDTTGREASRVPLVDFGAEQVWKWGIDRTGRLYGQTLRAGVEALIRLDPTTHTQTQLTGNYHWSHFAFGKGALRCDLAVTSVNSSVDFVIASDQTPGLP